MGSEMTEGDEFILNSIGNCFFCSYPIPTIDDEECSGIYYSIRLLSRYVEMDIRKVFVEEAKVQISSELLAQVEDARLKVILCDKCASLGETFSERYRQLKQLELEPGSSLKLIQVGLEVWSSFQELSVKLLGVGERDEPTDGGLNVLELLRDEAKVKCFERLINEMPRVQIERRSIIQPREESSESTPAPVDLPVPQSEEPQDDVGGSSLACSNSNIPNQEDSSMLLEVDGATNFGKEAVTSMEKSSPTVVPFTSKRGKSGRKKKLSSKSNPEDDRGPMNPEEDVSTNNVKEADMILKDLSYPTLVLVTSNQEKADGNKVSNISNPEDDRGPMNPEEDVTTTNSKQAVMISNEQCSPTVVSSTFKQRKPGPKKKLNNISNQEGDRGPMTIEEDVASVATNNVKEAVIISMDISSLTVVPPTSKQRKPFRKKKFSNNPPKVRPIHNRKCKANWSLPLALRKKTSASAKIRKLQKAKSVTIGARIKPPFKCDICQKTFHWKNNLIEHVDRHHEPNRQRPFKCDICSKSFFTSRELQQHNLVHTTATHFKCSICNKAFKRRNSWRSHMKTHDSNRERPFKCSICPKSFHLGSTLRKHMVVHSEERPFSCSVCDMAFKTKRELQFHTSVHSDLRPFQCQYCSKTFKRGSEMAGHERAHRGEHPHICDICGRRFLRKIRLRNHMKVHDDQKPFQCEACKTSFGYKRSLQAHHRNRKCKFATVTDSPVASI